MKIREALYDITDKIHQKIMFSEKLKKLPWIINHKLVMYSLRAKRIFDNKENKLFHKFYFLIYEMQDNGLKIKKFTFSIDDKLYDITVSTNDTNRRPGIEYDNICSYIVSMLKEQYKDRDFTGISRWFYEQ